MNRTLLGMLTPSSNTVLEPVTAAMLAGLPDVTAHFGRFRVTEISLRDQGLAQFDLNPMLTAADLLADAHVQSICWNGTSAGWLGFEADESLCAQITERTGISACTSVLAIREIFRLTGLKRYGLVAPYTDDVQAANIATFAGAGFECVAEQHLDIHVNFDFSEVTEARVAEMCRTVARARPEAIVVFCTNLRGGPVTAALEAELGIPVYDTVAAAVWAAMRQAGADPARVKGWGRLFQEVV